MSGSAPDHEYAENNALEPLIFALECTMLADWISMLDLLDVNMSAVVLEPFCCALERL
jgi:hypothetical protein